MVSGAGRGREERKKGMGGGKTGWVGESSVVGGEVGEKGSARWGGWTLPPLNRECAVPANDEGGAVHKKGGGLCPEWMG